MKKYLKSLWYHKAFIIIFCIVCFLGAYFVTDYLINSNTSYYELRVEGDVDTFFNEKYFEARFKEINDYNNNLPEGKKKISIANLEYKDIISSGSIINNNDGSYLIRVKQKYVKTTFVNSTGKLNDGKNRIYKYLNTISNGIVNINQEVNLIGYTNPYMVASFSLIGGLLISFILLAFLLKKEGEALYINIADNLTIFRTPFHLKYWLYSANVFKTIKNIAMIGILFAMMLVCKLIKIPAGFGPLSIGFGYIFFSIIGILYGPIAGLSIGFLSDILGFFLFPNGSVFFPGYTLDAMLAGFTYGIFFYKTKLTFAKCLYARMIVNLFINVLLGSIWWAIINSLTFDGYLTYMLFISLPKNLVYLLPQSIILFIVFKALGKPLRAMGLLDERIAENITLF